jgi:hypothetical protein
MMAAKSRFVSSDTGLSLSSGLPVYDDLCVCNDCFDPEDRQLFHYLQEVRDMRIRKAHPIRRNSACGEYGDITGETNNTDDVWEEQEYIDYLDACAAVGVKPVYAFVPMATPGTNVERPGKPKYLGDFPIDDKPSTDPTGRGLHHDLCASCGRYAYNQNFSVTLTNPKDAPIPLARLVSYVKLGFLPESERCFDSERTSGEKTGRYTAAREQYLARDRKDRQSTLARQYGELFLQLKKSATCDENGYYPAWDDYDYWPKHACPTFFDNFLQYGWPKDLVNELARELGALLLHNICEAWLDEAKREDREWQEKQCWCDPDVGYTGSYCQSKGLTFRHLLEPNDRYNYEEMKWQSPEDS